MATTIKTKALDAYHTNYKVPAHGWDENVYIDYQGAVRAMRFMSVIFEQDVAVDGYSKLRFPKTLFHVVIAGIGVVTLEANCGHYFPLKYQLSPNAFRNSSRRALDDAHRELIRADREYELAEWLSECFGVQPDQLGRLVRYDIHDGSAKSVVRYKWDGVKVEGVYFDIPKKAYYNKERGWHFDEPCELPTDTYATADECRFANELKVVEFEEDKPTPKKPIDKERLLQETIALLSSDLYSTMYQSDHFGGWGDVCDAIIEYAKRFEKELDWQDDDERDYMSELEAFENKVMKELNLID